MTSNTHGPGRGADSIIERFPALDAIAGCGAVFIKRVPGIDVGSDKAAAVSRLEGAHREVRQRLGLADWAQVTAEQVHGNRVAVVDAPLGRDRHLAGYDGFVTNQEKTTLGIYVADCCAVYIVDPKARAVGLVHSGKTGTSLGIAVKAIELMSGRFGSRPPDLVVQLSPCIRPPHYEIDFAAEIREQCSAAGVAQVHDCGICTGCDLQSYYSYRMEKGKTGRMLALLGLF